MNREPVPWWAWALFVLTGIAWYGMFFLPFVWAPLLIIPAGVVGFAIWRSFDATFTRKRRK